MQGNVLTTENYHKPRIYFYSLTVRRQSRIYKAIIYNFFFYYELNFKLVHNNAKVIASTNVTKVPTCLLSLFYYCDYFFQGNDDSVCVRHTMLYSWRGWPYWCCAVLPSRMGLRHTEACTSWTGEIHNISHFGTYLSISNTFLLQKESCILHLLLL